MIVSKDSRFDIRAYISSGNDDARAVDEQRNFTDNVVHVNHRIFRKWSLGDENERPSNRRRVQMRGRGDEEITDRVTMANRKLDEAMAVIVGKDGQNDVIFKGVIDQFRIPRK